MGDEVVLGVAAADPDFPSIARDVRPWTERLVRPWSSAPWTSRTGRGDGLSTQTGLSHVAPCSFLDLGLLQEARDSSQRFAGMDEECFAAQLGQLGKALSSLGEPRHRATLPALPL